MPDGTRFQRRFNSDSDTIQGVMNYIIKTANRIGCSCRLSTAGFPKKTFDKESHGTQTLRAVGITKNEAFIAEIK